MTAKFLGREPVLWLIFLQAAIGLALAFGLDLSAVQQWALQAFAAALIGLLVRQRVTPLVDPRDDAGRPLVPILPGVLYDPEPSTGSDSGQSTTGVVIIVLLVLILVVLL